MLITVRGSIHTVHVHVHCVHCVCRRLQFLKYFILSNKYTWYNGCNIMYIFKRGSLFEISLSVDLDVVRYLQFVKFYSGVVISSEKNKGYNGSCSIKL